MRLLFAAAIALSGALVGTSAMAQSSANDQTQSCYQEARRQGLSGEDLVNFMKSCTNGGQVAPSRASTDASQSCAARARLLSGEEKVQALRACN